MSDMTAITNRIQTLTSAFTTADINPSIGDDSLIGWLAGWDASTVEQIAGWITRAHAAGALGQRQADARTRLALIDPRFVTDAQWDGLACILCGKALGASERIGDINGYLVYACAGGCTTGSEHSGDPAPAGEGEITGGAEGECDHYWPYPEELGIDAEAFPSARGDCECGAEWDGVTP